MIALLRGDHNINKHLFLLQQTDPDKNIGFF